MSSACGAAASSKADILNVRRAYQALFFGEGEFRARLDQVEREFGGDTRVRKIVDFIRAGKRPLTMAIKRGETDEDVDERRRGRQAGRPARFDMRRRQPSACGRGFGRARADARCCCFRCAGLPIRTSLPIAIRHWVHLGQFGTVARIARANGCRDIVCLGSVVRPSLWQLRPDFFTLKVLPQVAKAFRGGDDHLLSSVGARYRTARLPDARRA